MKGISGARVVMHTHQTWAMALNMLEGFPLAKLPLHSPEHLHLLLEITKLAYADRDRWIADPTHSRPPLEQLLAKSYAGRRRAAFDPEQAQYHAWGDIDGDTTGFVVADARGNIMSVIQSLYKSFGSGVVSPLTLTMRLGGFSSLATKPMVARKTPVSPPMVNRPGACSSVSNSKVEPERGVLTTKIGRAIRSRTSPSWLHGVVVRSSVPGR